MSNLISPAAAVVASVCLANGAAIVWMLRNHAGWKHKERQRHQADEAKLAEQLKKARQEVRIADGGELTLAEKEEAQREKDIEEFRNFCFRSVRATLDPLLNLKLEDQRATLSFKGQSFLLQPSGTETVELMAGNGKRIAVLKKADSHFSDRLLVALADFQHS